MRRSYQTPSLGARYEHGPPSEVSRGRYRVGLVLFVLPLALGWLVPYFLHLLPGLSSIPMTIYFLGDLLFIASFFILGGDFWDKVRSLFMHGAKAQLPVSTA